MLSCALLVVLARKLFDRRVALLSGLFLATSPFLVKWSQQARVYPLLVAACLVATLLLLRAFERGSRADWALYGVALAAVLVAHAAVGLLLLPAHAVLVVQRRERFLPHGLLAVVVAFTVGALWVAQLALRTRSDTSETAWIPFPSAEAAVQALLAVSGLAGLGLLFALFGLGVLFRSGKRRLGVWLATWAFAPWAAALVISIARPIFLDRYLVVAAPAFAMLAAVAVMSVAVRARAAAIAAAVIATGLGLALWYSEDEPGNWRGEDWRGAVAFVADRRAEADALMLVPWWAHDAPEYYGARVTDTSTADSIWVLVWSEEGHELPEEVRRPLGFGEHELVDRAQFGWRVSAQLWVRSP
jgi:mannosyltransferase